MVEFVPSVANGQVNRDIDNTILLVGNTSVSQYCLRYTSTRLEVLLSDHFRTEGMTVFSNFLGNIYMSYPQGVLSPL